MHTGIKKIRVKNYLIFGIIWIALGITTAITTSDKLHTYGSIAIGILYLGIYILRHKRTVNTKSDAL